MDWVPLADLGEGQAKLELILTGLVASGAMGLLPVLGSPGGPFGP